LKVIINICRVFSDLIEKYLFDFNFIDPFKILFVKGIVQTLLIICFYLFNINDSKEEYKYLFSNLSNDKLYILNICICFFLILIYSVLSGFSNIYTIYTVKLYSPMTRTLADTALDIFYFLFYTFIDKSEEDGKNSNYFYISINIIFQIIIVFFNFVYNEFIILYCCQMENNTYLEITKRAISLELNYNRNDNNENNENNDNNDNFSSDINNSVSFDSQNSIL
jgi:hypothetical protein